MTWSPNLRDSELRKSTSGLLWEAYMKSQPNNWDYKLKDDSGVFALDTTKGILVAKRYIYGNVVSAHKRAVFSALNQKKPLVMYLKDADKFYKFQPEHIWKKSEENKRGNSIMLNWNIKLGERLEVL